MVKQNSAKRKRGRPKGSKNKRSASLIPCAKRIGGSENHPVYSVSMIDPIKRYVLHSRIEKDVLEADQEYYFLYDLNRGAIYPEIIARFTVETEAKLCVEFLNGIRKMSEKEYNKKRIHIPQE